MIRRRFGAVGDGFTLIELLIATAILGILVAIAVPMYLGFVQRARETALIVYLASVHKGQIAWHADSDAPGFTGDFDELEETGFLTSGDNSQAVRTRASRRGGTRTTSSRIFYGYQLDLIARDNQSMNTYTYSVLAHPPNRSPTVRWFYLDQTGVIRAGTGSAGPLSPPAI